MLPPAHMLLSVLEKFWPQSHWLRQRFLMFKFTVLSLSLLFSFLCQLKLSNKTTFKPYNVRYGNKNPKESVNIYRETLRQWFFLLSIWSLSISLYVLGFCAGKHKLTYISCQLLVLKAAQEKLNFTTCDLK